MRLFLFFAGCLLGGMASSFAANQDGFSSSEDLGRPALDGESSVATRLSDRAAALAALEKSLDAQGQDLAVERERIRADIARNEAIREELSVLIADLDARNAEQVLGQVKVYEKMRGPQAAAVLELTDQEIALAIIQGMRPDKSARVLSAMNPEIAARLTEELSAHPLSEVDLP